MKKMSFTPEQRNAWIRRLARCILLAAIPAGLFYCVSALILKKALGFNIMEVLRDMADQAEVSSFLGFMSSVGSWLWVAAATVCFFGAGILRSGSRRGRELLILTGLLSSIMAIDDFFMLHDRYINERLCYAAYAVSAGLLLLRHFRLILQIDGPAFLLAGGLLALSIFIDLIQFRVPVVYPVTQAIEEGCKFMGGGVWLYFACRAAAFMIYAPPDQDEAGRPARD